MISPALWQRLWQELGRLNSGVANIDELDRTLYGDAVTRHIREDRQMAALCVEIRRVGGFRPSPDELEKRIVALFGELTPPGVGPAQARQFRTVEQMRAEDEQLARLAIAPAEVGSARQKAREAIAALAKRFDAETSERGEERRRRIRQQIKQLAAEEAAQAQAEGQKVAL